MSQYRFTVLTCTYNRAARLPAVYESLSCQTFRDFEWLIVDDGSTDGTQEVAAKWKPSFPVRYFWKPNGGVHTAVNYGVERAQGELTLRLDSDDRCMPTALERFDFRWKQVSHDGRFAGVCCLCLDEEYQLIGNRFSEHEYLDAFSLGEHLKAVNGYERWGPIRTDLLRQFPSPVFPGEKFVPEGLVYNRIFSRYAIRFFNEALRVYCRTHGGLSRSRARQKSPRGTLIYYSELMSAKSVPLGIRIKSAINFARFAPYFLMRRTYSGQ